MNIKVNDKLYYFEHRRNVGSVLKETTVMGVGNKYLYVGTPGYKEQTWTKVDKKTLRIVSSYSSFMYYRSAEEAEKVRWMSHNVTQLSNWVRRIEDYELLKKIAEISGYKEDENDR